MLPCFVESWWPNLKSLCAHVMKRECRAATFAVSWRAFGFSYRQSYVPVKYARFRQGGVFSSTSIPFPILSFTSPFPLSISTFSTSLLLPSLSFLLIQGRVKSLSAAGSAAVLLNGIKESWCLARKILSQFKLLWFLNVLVTHYSPFSLFAAGSAEQPNSLQLWCLEELCQLPSPVGAFWALHVQYQGVICRRTGDVSCMITPCSFDVHSNPLASITLAGKKLERSISLAAYRSRVHRTYVPKFL